MSRERGNRSRKVYIVILFFILLITVYLIADQYIIVTTNYTLKSDKINGKITIAMISDLHNMNFGNNEIVAKKISEAEPDVIFVLGDIVDERTNDLTPALTVMNSLTEVADTYFIFGNHDRLCEQYDEFIDTIGNSGVTVLDDEAVQTTKNGNSVTILGLTSYFEGKDYVSLMGQLCENDDYKILLCHYPEYTPWFFEKDKYYEYDFDLMLSGHTHGGVVKLPFIGGIIAPSQGLFPEYVYGDYNVDKGNKNPYHMIITSGLGEDKRMIRVNNFPEIAVVTIEGE